MLIADQIIFFRSMNYYLIVYFAVLALEILICTLLKYFVYDNERISKWKGL